MHPSKFFNEVYFKTSDWDFGCISNDGIHEKLSKIHPMNFIKTSVELPVFEVDVSYDTNRNNRKTSTKIMVMNSCFGDDDDWEMCASIMAENEIAKRNLQYPKSELKNFKVEAVRYLAMAVLPIG